MVRFSWRCCAVEERENTSIELELFLFPWSKHCSLVRCWSNVFVVYAWPCATAYVKWTQVDIWMTVRIGFFVCSGDGWASDYITDSEPLAARIKIWFVYQITNGLHSLSELWTTNEFFTRRYWLFASIYCLTIRMLRVAPRSITSGTFEFIVSKPQWAKNDHSCIIVLI